MDSTAVRIGVIIVNYQSWGPLQTCLETISGKESEHLDVVVVDNDSPDDQFDVFRSRYPAVTFVKNRGNPGFANACNVGARETTAETLFFLNPDALFEPVDIVGLTALLKNNPAFGILSPTLEDADRHRESTGEVFPGVLTQLPLGRRIARALAKNKWQQKSTIDINACDYVPGCAFAISRDVFQQLGGWSEDFWMYCEDVDICWRAREAGLNVGWTENYTAVHIKGQSSESSEDLSIRCRAEHARARHILYSKHLSGINLVFTHLMEATKRLLRLSGSAILDIATGGKVQKHRIRCKTLVRLIGYYKAWLMGGDATIKLRVRPQ